MEGESMLSIREFTDEELEKQICYLKEDLDTYEYGSGDYNAALSEMEVALKEKARREKEN
jgi:hypothetical protein